MSRVFWNGNTAAAHAVRLARVQVIAAYPITPQTHCVETLAKFVNDGDMDAQMVKVESEHSAMSACAGAASVGARTFTASCSQGLALMCEVLYFTSGMRFPVVMGVANRTLSVPVNIWADHQDTLVNRDSGWLQLYASTVQEVHDLMVCAFRIAEHAQVALPIMVAYDGFILSHASEPVVPVTQEQADALLPPAGPGNRPILDPANPLQFGEVLFPDAYPDFEYKKHRALADSLSIIQETLDDFERLTGRRHQPVQTEGCEDADVVILGIGSMMATARHTGRYLRARGEKVGIATLHSFRPFPEAAVREAVAGASVVCVLDRDIGYGTSGMVFPDVTRTLYPLDERPRALNFVIGTGGKDITPATLERCLELARTGPPDQQVFWPDARGPAEGLPVVQAPAAEVI